MLKVWVAGMIIGAIGLTKLAVGLSWWNTLLLFLAMAAVSSLINLYWWIVIKK